GSPHDDVRRRGLQALIEAVRHDTALQAAEPARALLHRALNDPAAAVRGEAFKAAVNLKWDGGGADTLRLALQSSQADVRREVLTEVMAQLKEPWAWPLLLEFFDDPDAALRREAFEFATKKNKELEPLE